MKKTVVLSAATALGLAGALAFAASPAYATDFSDGDIQFGTEFYTFYAASGNGLYGAYPDDWQLGPNGAAFDQGMGVGGYSAGGSTYEQVQCTDPADLVTATDGSGDQILTCDPYTVATGDGELQVTLEYRFYADFSMVRVRAIITNTTASPVSGALIGLHDDYYQDGGTYLSATNSLGLLTGSWPATTTDVLTDNDLVYVMDDRGDEEDSPVVLTARGLAGSAVLPRFESTAVSALVAGNGEDSNDSLYRLPTLAPGQTVELALFHKIFTWGATNNSYEADTLDAVNAAWAEKGLFDSFSGALVAGIPDPSLVLNWNPAAAPALASTGSDLSGTVLVSAVLLVLGTAVVATSRLRRARQ